MPVYTGTTVVAVHVVTMAGERKGATSRTSMSAGMHITTTSVAVIVGTVASTTTTITITEAAVFVNRRYVVVVM
jgi:hypothetical protein